MPTYFQRPENALKRANEFIDVGKKQRALDVLYDVIKSKKHRTWQKIHEPIMEMYLELCVELRKSHVAKEGLYQYKNICQQVNIQSLVEVVRKYIALAEEKTDQAREQSHQTVVDIDDLDVPSPETLLLKAVSGEDAQDRTDRAILTPWVKFLWESYRQCLDLLRNNSRVERLYQDIAQQAFKFCLKYGRKTEFRKLCDNLRTHLGHVHKHQHQQTAINLNNPDSQAMHLETRLEQLNNAINMELWQEAFKAVEDIHGLISLSKKSPKPSLMANYYQKLGLVFWKSGSYLFHASTLHRVFHLTREQRKNLSQDELQKMASRVLCATLAIPIPASRNSIGQLLDMDESIMEKQRHLATLLMLPAPPTRQALVKDLVKYNILQYVSPELQNLYKWLEVEFHPLRLVSRVTPSIEFITKSEELSCYVPAIEDIIITRVLKQVSQVYQAIEMSRLLSLVPFSTQYRLERIIVNAAKTLELQVRICHKTKSISFGTNLGVAQKEDLPEGPYIQSMPSEQIRNQLTSMAHALQQAISIIVPKEVNETNELRATIINNYRMTSKKEHQRILQRRQIIEDRKEQLEHMNDQREREESQLAESQRKKAYEAEMARLEREALERKKQRQHQEHQEIKRKHVKERIEQLRKTDIGSRIFKDIDEEEFAELDVDEIMQKQVEQLEKEKRELQERLKGQEKKVDYFQRARRLMEIPLLEKQFEDDDIKARQFWEEHELERIETVEKERAYALTTQERLKRMKDDKDEFINQLRDARKSEYETHLKEFEQKTSHERKIRLQERKVKRKEERRIKWKEDRAEAKQRAKDEAMKREREEKERIELETREREENEYQERLAKLEAQAEKQRQREREIEERQKQRQEASTQRRDEEPSRDTWRGKEADGEPDWRKGDGPGAEKPAWKPKPREAGGWREREKERENRWKREPEGELQRDEGGWRDRAPPREERDLGALRDDRDFRDPPREDRSKGPLRDDRDFRDRGDRDFRDRAPPREDRDFRDKAPPREDRDFRDKAPPRDDRDFRDKAPPRDDRDFRDKAPPRDDRDFRDRAPPRDDRDFRDRAPPRDDRDFRDRAPPRDDRDFRDRAPPRDDRDFRDRAPPRDDFRGDRDFRDRAPPRDDRSFRDRGPPRDDRFDRGPRDESDRRGWRDHTGSPRAGTWRDRERDDGGWKRGGDDHRDDRGPPTRGESSWRERGPSARSDDHTPSNEKRPERSQEDDGWTTVKR